MRIMLLHFKFGNVIIEKRDKEDKSLRIDELPKLNVEGDWQKKRAQIQALLAQEEYGKIPPALAFTVKDFKSERFFAGKGFLERVELSFQNGEEEFSFPVQICYPEKREEKIPFFVFLDFSDAVPSKYFPAEEILDEGFGIARIFYQDVSKDANEFGEGLERLFLKGERTEQTFGKISLWAWAASRLLDYLLTRDLADEEKIGVIGHSRLGKTALWAAANDTRFTHVFSNHSGCSGAAISRATTGETVEVISRVFPHWFCKNYRKYANAEWEMPFDQHFLLSLIAPRVLAVGAAKEDTWADTYNQYLACKAALPAWERYGLGGGFFDETPQTGKRYGADGVYFREREGTHYLSRQDWHYYMEILRFDGKE